VKHYCCSVSLVGGLWASWMLYSGPMWTILQDVNATACSAAVGVAFVMNNRRRQCPLVHVW